MAATPGGALLTALHQRTQLQLRVGVLRDWTKLWPIWTGQPGSFRTLIDASVPLVQNYHRMSAGLSASYYRALRNEEVSSSKGSSGVSLPAPPSEDLIAGTLYLVGRDMTRRALAAGQSPQAAIQSALVRTAGAVTRLTLDGGREALVAAALNDGKAVGWRRVTTGTCDFCAKLAAEGVMRTTEFHSHDHCACVAEPAFADSTPAPIPLVGSRTGDKVFVRIDGELRKGTVARAPKDIYGDTRRVVNLGTPKKPIWHQSDGSDLFDPKPPKNGVPQKPTIPVEVKEPQASLRTKEISSQETPAAVLPDLGEVLGPKDSAAHIRRLQAEVQLTPDARASLKAYVNGAKDGTAKGGWHANTISRKLRTSKPLTGPQQKYVEDLDTAFKEVPATEKPMTLLRGVDTDKAGRSRLGTIVEGGIIEDSGFVSTTTSRTVASNFSGASGDIFEIVLPKGAKALDVNALKSGAGYGEREVVLPRGTRMIVESINRRTTKTPFGIAEGRLIKARVILPE